MARKSKKQSTPPPVEELSPDEIERLERLFDENEEIKALVEVMSKRVCDYCAAPVQWMSPDRVRVHDPQSFNEVLYREDLDPDLIEMAWECTGCDNFALMGADFEVQWLDTPAQCLECESYRVTLLDPAQVASIDRARYLQMKKLVGAETLLSSQAQQCHDCGMIDFLPVTGA